MARGAAYGEQQDARGVWAGRRTARPPPTGAQRCAASAAALCSRHGQAARRAADRAAPLSPPCHASAAPAGPGAAPCAGVAWTAGALVRVGGRHCAGRGQAPVSRCSGRAARNVPGAGGVGCGRCLLSEGRYAPSGPLWLRRSGPRKACGPQLCRPLPQGSVKVEGQLEDALALRGSQRGDRLRVSAASGTAKAAGRAASSGSAPNNPGRRSPSRVGVGGEAEGRHCGAVQDRRAARGCLAWPGTVVGVGASRWPGVIARQALATRVPARHRGRSRWAAASLPRWRGHAGLAASAARRFRLAARRGACPRRFCGSRLGLPRQGARLGG